MAGVNAATLSSRLIVQLINQLGAIISSAAAVNVIRPMIAVPAARAVATGGVRACHHWRQLDRVYPHGDLPHDDVFVDRTRYAG